MCRIYPNSAIPTESRRSEKRQSPAFVNASAQTALPPGRGRFDKTRQTAPGAAVKAALAAAAAAFAAIITGRLLLLWRSSVKRFFHQSLQAGRRRGRLHASRKR